MHAIYSHFSGNIYWETQNHLHVYLLLGEYLRTVYIHSSQDSIRL